MFPLKILAVFMHELSHGFAGIITGGSIDSISLSIQEGGHAYIRGGNRFLTLSAGYLGSLIFGVTLLLLALKTQADRVILGAFGVITILVTALYIRDLFPLVFCITTGLIMLGIAGFLSARINDFVLRIIGLTNIIYVPLDIFSDTISRPEMQSDASMLAQEFWGATMFWGGIWLLLSLVTIALCIRYAIGEDSNL